MPAPRHPLPKLLRYGRRYRAATALASAFSILNKLFDLAPPFLIGAAVDVVVNRDDAWLGRLGVDSATGQLWVLAALTVVIWTFESVFEYAHAVYWRNLAQRVEHDLRLDAYDRVQMLEIRYFEDRSTGGLLSILNDDVNQLERFLDGGANDLIQLAVTAITIGVAFFIISPSVAWLAMLPMPFVIIGSLHFQKLIGPRYDDVRASVGDLNRHLANNIGGIATIKSFTAETYERERIAMKSASYRETNRRAIRFSSAFSPLIRMVIVAGFTVTLVYGGIQALDGRLNVGAYSIMVFLTQRLLWPFTRLGAVLDLYQRAMASTRRIFDLLETAPRIVSGPERLSADEARGRVAFEDVRFAYHKDYPVLHDASLVCEAGCTTAIVGLTGSGKTTLIKLLLRYEDLGDAPEHGRVTIDGHDLRDLDLDSLRQSIALVSQDIFLFDGTVRENIAYGRLGLDGVRDPEEVDDARIEAAARAAEAHEFIERLPYGYDTIVGERGQKLSGGQRQRIAMSRAIVKDAPILVLDEATSSVDNETEAAIQRSLERVCVGRTTIVIAHRLSTIRHAHRIYVLDAGRVVEAGDHEALVADGGIYAKLWLVQTGEAVGA